MENCDPRGLGPDAFFPRSHVISSAEALQEFQRDFVITEAESYLHRFIKKLGDLKRKAAESEEAKAKLSLEEVGFLKEKLLVCCNILRKRMKDVDIDLDKKKGITVDQTTVGTILVEERSFLLRDPKTLTPGYLKYIKNEDWYSKAV